MCGLPSAEAVFCMNSTAVSALMVTGTGASLAKLGSSEHVTAPPPC